MTLSVRGRLTLWYLLVLGLSLIALEFLVYLAVRGSIARMIDTELDARLSATADFLEQHLKTDPPGELQVEFQEYAASIPGGELLQISDASGAWIFQSESLRKHAIPPTRPNAVRSGKAFRTLKFGRNTTLRTLDGEKRINSSLYLIQVAEDMTQPRAILSKLRWLLLVLTPVCLGLAAAGGYWLSTRALEPVMRMTREARSISSERLHQRLEVPKTSDELQALAETLNSMLARIESSFKRTMQFTADASHELRTPVTIMRSTAEIALRRRRDEGEYKRALESIVQEAESTGNLIEDLLTLARLDSAQPLAVTNVDIRKTVEAAFARVSSRVERKQITSSLDSGNDDAWILGDKEALIRLFFTLLDNSVKYTHPNGTIGVNICTTDDHVAVEVCDSGVGIPDAEILRIFDRFYRVDKVRSREEGGFGLGLAIAKSIAEMHHAQLSVESVEGQGSKFRVVFDTVAPRHAA